MERVGIIILRTWGLKFKQILGIENEFLGFSELRFGIETFLVKYGPGLNFSVNR